MKFSLQLLLLIVLVIAILFQGVQVIVDRVENRRLQWLLNQDRETLQRLQHHADRLQLENKACRAVLDSYEDAADFTAAKRRFDELGRGAAK